MRKHHPNKAHSDIIRDACSGLTSASDPVSCKMRAVVSLVLPKQNYTNLKYTDPLGAHIDTHTADVMRKHHPNKAHSDITRDACSGLTSAGDPVFM